jgi:regulation of enolase protein 1 (concanavalin A-like superfamily)
MAWSALVGLALFLSACSQTLGSPPDSNDGSGWRSADVGEAFGGRTEIAGDAIMVQGIGDVAFDADAFHFTYRALRGDGSIVARLADHTGGTARDDFWPKAGIMIRDSLEPQAANALLFIVDNAVFQGAVFQERRTTAAETSVIGARSAAVAPYWLRLERSGTTVRGFASPDGADWALVGTATVSLGQDVLVGLAVASGERDGILTLEAVYDGVEVEGQPGGRPAPSPTPQPEPNPGPRTSTTYTVDQSGIFPNPERGWHHEVNLLARTGYSSVTAAGYTLGRNYIRLDSYRHSPLPASLLTDLAAGLAEARNHGIKIILRFSYNFGWEADAPLDTVLTHIEQLRPILEEYQDVIAVLQAGFIGAWGEWHSSTYGLLELGNKRTITNALLDALPDGRMIQIRTPGHIRDVVGSPSPSLDVFSTEPQARVGFKNDCFLSSSNDAGTYLGDQQQDRAEAATLTRYTVMGGETCSIEYPTPRNSCEVALRELEQFHWDYINTNWYVPVYDRWRSEGCYDEITRRMGYRLSLTEGAVTEQVAVGDTITLELDMTNSGFGKVYNPRPIEIVLRNVDSGAERRLRVTGDARSMLPLAGETRTLQLSANVPADMPAGSYRVLLNLPDAAPNLANDVRYSIRLANVGTWEAPTGYNDLLLTTTVVR